MYLKTIDDIVLSINIMTSVLRVVFDGLHFLEVIVIFDFVCSDNTDGTEAKCRQ